MERMPKLGDKSVDLSFTPKREQLSQPDLFMNYLDFTIHMEVFLFTSGFSSVSVSCS